MKKTLLTLSLLLFMIGAKAQLTDSARNSNDMVYTAVEHQPEYPGGITKFYRFLTKTIRYPAVAREHNTQGKVIVTMVVEKDGSLSQVHVTKSIGDGCDEEAMRVVKLSAPWTPGTQNGKAVRVEYSMPISFTLAN